MTIPSFSKITVALAIAATLGFAAGRPASGQSYPGTAASETNIRELLETSLRDKRGLTFYFNGETIPGIVTRITGEVVEARSQMFGRIMIRLDRIDAVAIN